MLQARLYKAPTAPMTPGMKGLADDASAWQLSMWRIGESKKSTCRRIADETKKAPEASFSSERGLASFPRSIPWVLVRID